MLGGERQAPANVHHVALSIHHISLNVHNVAPNIHTIALNVTRWAYTPACRSGRILQHAEVGLPENAVHHLLPLARGGGCRLEVAVAERLSRSTRQQTNTRQGLRVDVKGYSVDAKGYTVDVSGYNVDAKGYTVDVKGYN
eukprot:1843081-Pyramimonas_sp.AAC.1